ncbi:uracil phosphoribosyltransferase [Elioraea sp. Yellowstone]|jgi:uracil phosphoribosyltransferase|uniref:uracil phosphoribosyltransferase n=1 Tax=Elioraea sp. Yellowstone TaxID=2592070 RepID=UPI001F011CE7|nr:uracil phosphoribosyltransferase [Elioraea sp. Yellowstone]
MPGAMTPRLIDHPLAQDALTTLRRAGTPREAFRAALHRIALLLAAGATERLHLAAAPVVTPLEGVDAPVLAGPLPCLVPVLRAGLGLLDGFLALMPAAPVAHFGAYRDHATLATVEYSFAAPTDLALRAAIVLDPMLATGNTAAAACTRLKAAGARDLAVACVLAAPEGLARLAAAHPDVTVTAIAVDRGLDERGYIRPGLGDAGDRLFGTG